MTVRRVACAVTGAYVAGVLTVLWLDAREALRHRPTKMGRLAEPRALR